MSIPSRSDRRIAALLLGVALAAIAPRARAADEDPMAPFRERFKTGMDRYVAGDYAAALRFWEPIYAELGPARGYRLSFDLARAYEKFGDATRAAERYESFLAEVDARRARGEAIEPKVASEESDAKGRLAELRATRGRIHVPAGPRAVVVQIDGLDPRLAPFSVYVPPGSHAVTFAPGAPDAQRRTIDVQAGQTIDVPPPEERPAPPPPSAPQPTAPAVAPPPSAPPTRIVHEESHPFSPVVLYAAGGATVASAVVCALEYGRALSSRSAFDRSGDHDAQAKSDYEAVRPWAYGSLAATAGLAVVTAGLTTWWFVGAKERDVPMPVVPSVAITPHGATAGAIVRF